MKKKLILNLLILSIIYGFSCSDDSTDEGPEDLASPILLDLENVTEESFDVKWIGDATATADLLDVATDADFTNILSAYNNQMVSGESATVSGLDEDTQYFVRMSSTRDGELSALSATKSTRTVDVPDPEPEIFLRTLTSLPIGAAVQAGRLSGSYGQLVAQEHSSLTAEFEMKMEVNFTAEDEYNFGPGDQIVAFAEANDMQVHGHSLIWHLSTPEFVENFAGTDEQFEEMIKNYIHTVVGHYRGKVVSWDVVNEAVNDENGQLRNSIYRQKMGDDFIAKCFQYAREADPDVLLFYNDYSIMFDETKLGAALDIISDMQDRGIDVDGLGFQTHIDIRFPSRSTMAASMQKAVDLGLKVHISELDIKVNPDRNNNFVFNTSSAASQRTKYVEVVEEFLKLPEENQFAITMWGVIDGQSWIPVFFGAPDFPLLFNDDLSPKSAHTGFAEVLDANN